MRLPFSYIRAAASFLAYFSLFSGGSQFARVDPLVPSANKFGTAVTPSRFPSFETMQSVPNQGGYP
jgi:hypothetical protein